MYDNRGRYWIRTGDLGYVRPGTLRIQFIFFNSIDIFILKNFQHKKSRSDVYLRLDFHPDNS